MNTKQIGFIFDMDGVIFDSESLWKEAFFAANEKFNADLSEKYRQEICGKDENSIRRELKLLRPHLDVDRYRNWIMEYVGNRIEERDGVPMKEGFLELLGYIKANGFQTALATSTKRERAHRLFQKKGLDLTTLFDAAVFADDVKVSKPNPAIFLLAAERIGIAPSRGFVIEDSPNGIAAAKAGGFSAILAIDLIEPTEQLKNECILTVRSLFAVLDYLRSEAFIRVAE